ncbi:MAG: helix-turn-helix domain-containing protein [Deltaproteobacteria bacterium]|nr:helix-turn-helix domain-containing protein [Deltaproteobacteria bacterium]
MEIMNPDDVSRWFRIPKSTLYKLCLAGQIPSKKIGKHWRFDRGELERWFKEKENF